MCGVSLHMKSRRDWGLVISSPDRKEGELQKDERRWKRKVLSQVGKLIFLLMFVHCLELENMWIEKLLHYEAI